MAVKEALSSIKGLKTDQVEIGRAVVETSDYDAISTELTMALEEEGYPVSKVERL